MSLNISAFDDNNCHIQDDTFNNGIFESSQISSLPCIDYGFQDEAMFFDSKIQPKIEVNAKLNVTDLQMMPTKSPTWNDLCVDEVSLPTNQEFMDDLLPAQNDMLNCDSTLPGKFFPLTPLSTTDQLFLPSPSMSAIGEIQNRSQKKSRSFSRLIDKDSSYIESNALQTPVKKAISTPNLVSLQESDYSLWSYHPSSVQKYQMNGKYFSTPSPSPPPSFNSLPLSPPSTKASSQLGISLNSKRQPSLALSNECNLEKSPVFDSIKATNYTKEQNMCSSETNFRNSEDSMAPIITSQDQWPLNYTPAYESNPTSCDIYNAEIDSTSFFLWDQAQPKKTLTLSSSFESSKLSENTDDWYSRADSSRSKSDDFEMKFGQYLEFMSTGDNPITETPLTNTSQHEENFQTAERKSRFQREESPSVQVSKRKHAKALKPDSTRSSSRIISYINFTQNDSRKILAGVAPSGSNKTKARREKEAMRKQRRWTQSVMNTYQKAVASGKDLSTVVIEQPPIEN